MKTVKDWAERLREEGQTGGGESPCPSCGLPRSKRSDYLRCVRCAINWLEGEDLSKDPREERRQKFLESVAAIPKTKKESR